MSAQPTGATTVEVYGFVGWITSSVAYVLYLLWAFMPSGALHAAGITYYPSKYWALALPVWVCLTVVFAYWAYEALNMMAIRPVESPATVTDAYSRAVGDVGLFSAAGTCGERIPPLADVPPAVVSRVLVCGESVAVAEQGRARRDAWLYRRAVAAAGGAAAAAHA